MLISKRAAADLLRNVGISRRHAEQVLDAGLAGQPSISSSSWLYSLDVVLGLVKRPVVSDSAATTACPHGLFVARGPAALADPSRWSMSPFTRLHLRLCLAEHGPLPLIATVGGFVAHGADISAIDVEGDETTFTLAPAGAWFTAFHDHRYPTGPGKSWLLQGRHSHGQLSAPPDHHAQDK